MIKRCIDIVVAGLILTALLPLIIVLSALIYLQMGSPVLFRQIRAGLYGRPFTIIKFRTMRDVYGADRSLLPDSERLTRLGQFLRSSSLDELPGLWNVITGDLSLVGPRPLLMEYLPLYSLEQARRHEVKSGITGWAQVNGRNALSWEEKFSLDVWYVDNRSICLDFKILFLTAVKVISREGVNASEHETMPYFTGTPSLIKLVDHEDDQ
jgi:lipopolysaccharide/colanic/teichoic acid biosynthesis glycosyltransferase